MPHVVGGVTLVAPRRSRDCACVFCGLFRAHHYWVRAVLATVVAVLLVLAPGYVEHEMTKAARAPADMTVVVGGLWLVATGAAVLALGSWRLPARRALHLLRPRLAAHQQL
jgi:hypothetical protein